MEAIKVNSLNFSYPNENKKALNNIELSINEGEFILVCGASGGGKSTLLKHLKPELTPYGERDGEVIYYGENIEKCDFRKTSSEIGYVLQNPESQIVTDKVYHELAFGLENLGVDTQTIRRRVAEMSSFFGIQGWFRRDVVELSGGQKQLLNLAAIMVMQPKVLILDEPTSQLDPIAAKDFLDTLVRINRELSTTIIITEHNLEDIYPVADKVIVIDEGNLLAAGTPKKVAEILCEDNKKHKMVKALPTPTRIYKELRNKGFINGTLSNERNKSLDSQKINNSKIDSLESKDIENLIACTEESNMKASLINLLENSKFNEDRNSLIPIPLDVRSGKRWIKELLIEDVKVKSLNKTSYEIPNGETAIELKDIWFKYDKTSEPTIRNVSLKVKKGEFYSILGGNGTGKSTTLSIISGQRKPFKGKVFIDDIPIKKYKNNSLYKGNLGVLPQNPQSLFVFETVKEDLEEVFIFDKLDKGEIERRVLDIANKLNIAHLLNQHPYDLSGGEIQRAALAKVLLLNPRILLLDEPTKGLDAYSKEEIGELLLKLKSEGMTILLVSHDIEFCANYSDRCAMFFDGSIVSEGEPVKFFSGNNFYTTVANRMTRDIFKDGITCEDVVKLCTLNLKSI